MLTSPIKKYNLLDSDMKSLQSTSPRLFQFGLAQLAPPTKKKSDKKYLDQKI